MTLTTRKAGLSGLAILGASALVLTGCASAPEAPTTPSDEPAGDDFYACMVSDQGGFDDKSFNQLGKVGLDRAASELGIKVNTAQSSNEDDYAPNIEAMINDGCDMIVTVGFLLSAATIDAAKANPTIEFAIVDDALDGNYDNQVDVDNGKPILFNTATASFLAGYAAAAYSKTGVVGTFGGMQINSVTIFMDGFFEGVQYYNEENGASVKVVGWDADAQTGVFNADGFTAGVPAKTAAQGLLDQGADVLFPVGGPIYQSAGEAIREKGGDIALIGVDADVYETDPDFADLLLTSVLKQVDVGVFDVIKSAVDGSFDNTPYVGTIESGGVGIAPFHDFTSKVPADLGAKLEDLKGKLVSGEITVESPAIP